MSILKEKLELLLKNLNEQLNIHQGFIENYGPQEKNLALVVAELTKNEEAPHRQRLNDELLRYGPIEPLLEDEEITEIIINSPNDIFIERLGHFSRHEDTFLSLPTFMSFVQRLQFESKIQADLKNPFIDGKWKCFRMHLALPPLVPNYPHLTLRRQKSCGWSLQDLQKREWADEFAFTSIHNLIQQSKNILIIGTTGSGKTSFLSACLKELPEKCRVVAIEDTDEITLPNRLSTKLLTRRDPAGHLPEITQEALLKQSLRMRPERLIMGEVRGQEAKDLLLTLSTGHRGSLATLHASSRAEALKRLEVLVQMGAPQWSLDTIRFLIFKGFDIIVTVDQIAGQRRLKEIAKISSLEREHFTFEVIWQRKERDEKQRVFSHNTIR
ncbi:MAG: CpaF family protein [Bdellovibrionales bacterium]|nr:CpaF family protein [Bdellovibrionales bacterium]